MDKKYWEDFTVGQIFEFGDREVSEEEVIEFATEFDPQSFHIDPAAAKDHFFGGLIASGWHTGSMLMRMIVDAQISNSSSMGSPGMDQLRWISPVRPGETLKVISEVIETSAHRKRADRGFVKFEYTVLNQDDKTKMTMTSTIIFGRLPTAEVN